MNYLATEKSKSTVEQSEMKIFKAMTNFWWDELGPMKVLHRMNTLRVPFIKKGFKRNNVITDEQYRSNLPLENLDILDVGCGGGILSEQIAKLGANVTAIDITEDMIKLAKEHAKNSNNLTTLNYQCISVEEHFKENYEKYDAVIASEVVDHVTEKQIFLENCIKCLKPGGSIFITTINQTFLSKYIGIYAAERLLNVVPKGTHEWSKFIKPNDLKRMLEKYNCKTVWVHGMCYNIITKQWFWSPSLAINYVLHAVKNQ